MRIARLAVAAEFFFKRAKKDRSQDFWLRRGKSVLKELFTLLFQN
jgi:hypothetical protein